MSKLIICPYHSDHKPSLRIYGEWAHCFSCGAHVLTSELNTPEAIVDNAFKAEPTNITNMIKYIEGLTIETVRGLQLHTSERGYYVIWPNKDYYKLRLKSGTTRYIGPSGVKAPLFTYPGSAKHLVIVEGELNAMTLHNCVYGEFKIVSPGSASELQRHIKYYIQFQRITIIVDYDAPGIVFGCALKEHLLQLNKRVDLIALKTDFNDVLVQQGEDAVKQLFEKEMGL